MIKFENVSKVYGDGTVAVDSLNVEINQGEFFVLIGPSGSGKTTSLKMINQLVPLSDGMIYINGKKIHDYDIYELRWNIGYVLQQIALFPHMTIEQNITVVPEMKKWSKEKMKKRAYELMEMVGLDPHIYADRKPHQLSGGEQQRVGVIRALAADSEIILMDEPFSALDPISREKLQDDLLHLKNNLKKTTVFVTHDMQEALKLADRICIMKDGKVVQVGTPYELIHHPVDEFVQQFVGGKSDRFGEDFQLKKILVRTEETNVNDHLRVVNVSASLHEVLEKLSEDERLQVEENGKLIGFIDRRATIQYLSKNVRGRGQSNE
ncbi:ABC transporter ATP-binding protein [Fervidibacillus halotolerans]|uniref:Carnitine transport ATP-binding protein OpuCA n=1 Tax=Fervidibacillus halotolerans TaxID=2980027 RepID=A0A9E8LZH1_9BACI|nr:ABC transporter ATP-binding protein [Fervidibacillus halotolerans]WAA12262.1 ABC transporter ATP-binding protein [Fervidibacillus halotolerans]